MFFCAIRKSPQPRIITINYHYRFQHDRIRGCGERKERKRLHITSPGPDLKQKIAAASYARFSYIPFLNKPVAYDAAGLSGIINPLPICTGFINKKPPLYSWYEYSGGGNTYHQFFNNPVNHYLWIIRFPFSSNKSPNCLSTISLTLTEP